MLIGTSGVSIIRRFLSHCPNHFVVGKGWVCLITLRGAIKQKKLPNFGHCPNMGGGCQQRSQTFYRKKEWTCFKGGGGSKGHVHSGFLYKSLFWGP